MPARKARGSVSHLPIRDVKDHLPKEDDDVPYTDAQIKQMKKK